MLVQPLINRGTPDGSLVLREGLLDVLNTLRCSENTGNVDMFRIALGEESLHTHLHADTRGKHRVGNDEHLISKIRRLKGYQINPVPRTVKDRQPTSG